MCQSCIHLLAFAFIHTIIIIYSTILYLLVKFIKKDKFFFPLNILVPQFLERYTRLKHLKFTSPKNLTTKKNRYRSLATGLNNGYPGDRP